MPASVHRRISVVALAVVAVAVAIWGLRAEQRTVAADLARARDQHGVAFTGAAACARCHPEHMASWRRTFHRTMTRDVSPAQSQAVAGDFSGVTYRYGDVTARMHRDGAGRFVMTFARNGAGARVVAGAGEHSADMDVVDAVVVRAVGSRRYQQYLAEVGGALWRLPLAFHIEERRWFHMNGAFLTPDPQIRSPESRGDETAAAPAGPRFGGGDFDRHVTRWNDNCVFCHNVGPNPGRDPASGAFRTTVAELGIACEACHGPGEEHARVNGNPVRRYQLHRSATADPTIVNPSRLSPARAADVCGRCHGQRISDNVAPFLEHGDPFVPGDDLALYSAPLWNDTTLKGDSRAFAARFWGDGTARLTAYEYQGLLQSRCAQVGGLTCTTCHGMHEGDPRGQVRPAAAGDGACTGCHAGFAGADATALHSRHRADGPGARCVSCHMPRIVYGVLDVHPSHRIERPDPARASVTGRPDACTLCHVEQDRAWAVRERARLWPPAAAAGPPAPAVASARADERGDVDFDVDPAPRTAAFGGDPIARAVAVDAIGHAPWPAPTSASASAYRSRVQILLEVVSGDRYPAVRHLAARALSAVLATDKENETGNDAARTRARTYDATAPAAERAAVVADLRRLLAPAGTTTPQSGDPEDPARIARLRAAARGADIDIGE